MTDHAPLSNAETALVVSALYWPIQKPETGTVAAIGSAW